MRAGSAEVRCRDSPSVHIAAIQVLPEHAVKG
jgi:hypothetical protein